MQRRKIPLTEILTENSTYDRCRLKERLLKEGLLNNICYSCGLGPFWNDKPLVLQLDHINGKGKDNRLENLQILCPNCHTQTPTYAGRNSSWPIPRCAICNKPKSRTSAKLCRSCAHKGVRKDGTRGYNRKTKIEWPSIEELKREKATSTYVAMAKRLGVSDKAIAKRIKEYG